MRKLRIFMFDIVAPGVVIGWLLWKYPETLDTAIPWIVLGILWHLTFEIGETDPVRPAVVAAYKRWGSRLVAWLLVALIGSALSLGYWYSIQRGMRKLATLKSPNGKTTPPANPPPLVPPAEKPPQVVLGLEQTVTANVWMALLNGGQPQLWGVYRSGYGDTVTPIDALLLIRVTKTAPVTLDSIFVEVLTANGWMALKSIPLVLITPFWGVIKNAGPVEFNARDIHDVLRTQSGDVMPQTLRGVGLFEYSDPSHVHPGGATTFRITITDTAARRVMVESTPSGEPLADPGAGLETFAMKGTGVPVDLTKLKLHRMSEPFK